MRTAIAILLISLAACSEGELKTQPDGATPSSAPTTTQRRAKVGDSFDLAGQSDEQLRVTVLKLVDPAKSADFQPEADHRFVAIQMKIENIGSKLYDDSPGNGARLIDVEGQTYQTTLADAGGPSMSSVKIGAGDFRTGFLAFEVPTKTKVARFQWTASSGFADETGEWLL